METRAPADASPARPTPDPADASPQPTPDPADAWLTPTRFGLLLVLLLCAAHPEVVLGRHTFVHRDFMAQVYPVAAHHRAAFLAGELPLWNPLNAAGLPFLAQWSTLVLYPLSAIYLAVPPPWGVGAFCLLHVLLAGCAMYALAFDWTRSASGAALAGVAYAFGGVMQAMLHLPAAMASLGWAPVVVWAVGRACARGGRWIPLAALVGALQMLGAYPEFVLLSWLLATALAFASAGGARRALLRTTARLAGVVALVSGLAAAQLLPFLELLAASHRGSDFAAASDAWAIAPAGLATLVVPLFGAVRSIHGVYFQPGQEYFSSHYLGIAVLGLALLAVLRAREARRSGPEEAREARVTEADRVRARRIAVLAVAAVLGLVLAMGSYAGVYDALVRALPLLGVARYPVKFVALTALAVPLLAAFGVAAAARGRARADVLVPLGLLCVLAVLVVVARGRPVLHEPWTTVLSSGVSRAGLLLVTCAALALARSGVAARLRAAAALLAVLGVAADLLTLAPSQNPTVDVRAWRAQELRMAPRPAPGVSRAMLTPERYHFFQGTGSPDLADHLRGNRLAQTGNLNLLDGVPKLDGHYWVYLAGDWQLRSRLYASRELPPAGILDFLGVSMASAPDDRFGWRPRPGALPLATGGQRPVFAGPSDSLAGLLADDFDPRTTVYLPPEARAAAPNAGAAEVEVALQDYSAHAMSFEVRASAPAWVVIAQSHHTPWRASLDGAPTPIHVANVAYQAVAVPAGRRHLRLVYDDRAFRLGAGLSLASLAVCVLWLVALRRGARAEPR